MYAQLTCTGLIPADSGKTSRFGDFGWGTAGSSPLTQEKPLNSLRRVAHGRFIPAHAGKTRVPRTSRLSRWDHPRSRGENAARVTVVGFALGSSPLTRGKLVVRVAVQLPAGLIPTHAGKTPARPEPQASPRAHPRSRGENLPLVFLCTLWWGSSPLTRGKRRHNPATTAVVGLIPTHAGSTSWMQGSRPTCGAHPHSRGENSATSLTDEEWE